MKKRILILIVLVGLFVVGCCSKQPLQVDAPLRLTREEVLRVEDGDRIVIYFPHGVERPVVFKSVETDGWVVSGKVIDD